MKRIHFTLVVVACLLLIMGCAQSKSASDAEPRPSIRSASSAPSKASVEGKGPIEALAIANEWMGNGVTTYVTTEAINFEFSGGAKAVVDLPADRMVVAIAPYLENTHPCQIHYMSGCQGELVGVPIDVTAELANGTVLLEETIKTMSNGFIELWLPRDQEISLRLASSGKSVSGTIGTFADSNTCITTLQLM